MKLFKKTVSLITILAVVLTMFTANVFAAKASDFADFPTDWSAEAMKAAIDNGLIFGRSNNEIVPYGFLTRAEMAAIINRAFGADKTAPISQYEDVSPSDWFYTEMGKAVRMQTFNGISDTEMAPDACITRQEAFTVIARAMVISNYDYSILDKFTDKSDIADWALPYLTAMTANGYVNGNEMGEIKPLDYITRAEFAQMMHNMFKTYFSTGGFRSGLTLDGNVMINTEAVSLTNVVINGDLVIGDGANETQVILTNVTVNGRLLVRGASYVRLNGTTVEGALVVNNLNNVVYFDNLRTESVFDHIVENTAAKYKEGSFSVSTNPGSSSSSSKKSAVYTVERYMQNLDKTYKLVSTNEFSDVIGAQVSADTPNYTGYTLNTSKSKVSGTVVWDGSLVLQLYYDLEAKVVSFDYPDGVVFDGEKTESYEALYGETLKLPANVRKEEGGIIYAVDYWLNSETGEKIYPTDEIKVTDHITLTPVFTEGCLITFDDDGNIVAKIAVKKGAKISDSIKAMPEVYFDGYWEAPYSVWDGKSYLHKIAQDYWYDDVTDDKYTLDTVANADVTLHPAWALVSLNLTDTTLGKNGTASIEYNSDMRYADTVKDFIFQNKSFIELSAFDDIKNKYLDKLKANDLLDDAKNLLKYKSTLTYTQIFGEEFLKELMYNNVPDGADADEFVNAIIDEMSTTSTITATPTRIPVITALKTKVDELEYNDVSDKVPANYKQYLSLEDQEDIFANAKTATLAQLQRVIATGSGTVDCKITFSINPVSTVIIPMYDSLIDKYENTANKVWNVSENYKKLMELISPENLLNGTKSAETEEVLSGYSLKSADEYYELLKEAVVLLDYANADFMDAVDNGTITRAQYEAFAEIMPNHIISYLDLVNSLGNRFFGSAFSGVTAEMVNKRFAYLTNLCDMYDYTTDEMFSFEAGSDTADTYTITFGALKFKFTRSDVRY